MLQISINRDLVEFKIVHSHSGIVCSHKKEWGHSASADMEWSPGCIVQWKKQGSEEYIWYATICVCLCKCI